MPQPKSFRRLLDVLQQQEAALGALVVIAGRQQDALVASDYAGIERNAREMAQATVIVGELDLLRDGILADMGRPNASIQELVDEAAAAGVSGLDETRQDLDSALMALRSVQEVNARIILSASKLVDRWVGTLAGLAGGTYGAGGKTSMGDGASFVSRQA